MLRVSGGSFQLPRRISRARHELVERVPSSGRVQPSVVAIDKVDPSLVEQNELPAELPVVCLANSNAPC